MRKSLKRAFALATAVPSLAAVLATTAPAAHADVAPTCGAGSTVLADFYTLGGFHTRIASYVASSTVRHICITVAGVQVTVVTLNSGVAVTPPSVTQATGTGRCAQPIVDMTAPLALSLSAGVTTTGPALCIGQNGVTTTVSFNAATVQSTPDADVWAFRSSLLNMVPCGDEYVRATVNGTYWDWYSFDQCYYYNDNRII